MPSIEQVMPWLRLIFDAYEDYRKQREHEATERAALEAQGIEAMRVFEDQEMPDDHGDDADEFGDGKRKKDKKKKKHKDKKKHRDQDEE